MKIILLFVLLFNCMLYAGGDKDSWKIFPDNIKTIAIVAPGMPGKKVQVDIALAKLRAAGYKVKVMPNARLYEYPSEIKKVPAEKRFNDLMQAWFDPEVDAIWCVRGGNYSRELVKLADYDKMRKRPMILIGFSDITCLQQALQKNNVGRVFSGPSLTSMLRTDQPSRDWFKRCLGNIEISPVKLKTLRGGSCSGKAVAGHLFLINAAVNGKYAVSTADKIVFLESSIGRGNEKILKQLVNSGYFKNCKAVVFGEFINMSQKAQLKMFQEFTKLVSCPVYYGYPYGHGTANYLIDVDRVKHIGEDAVLRQ